MQISKVFVSILLYFLKQFVELPSSIPIPMHHGLFCAPAAVRLCALPATGHVYCRTRTRSQSQSQRQRRRLWLQLWPQWRLNSWLAGWLTGWPAVQPAAHNCKNTLAHFLGAWDLRLRPGL